MSNLTSLDLLLFSNKSYWFSWIVELFTLSKWSHVGFAMNGKDIREIHSKFKKDVSHIDPEKIYFWESGIEPVSDSEDSEFKFGIQLSELEPKIKRYNGEISIRKLKINLNNNHFQKLIEIHKNVHDKPYDSNIIDLIEAWLGIDIKGNSQHTSDFFCSAFVGYVYTQLGFMPEDTHWSLLKPKYFASENVSNFLNEIEKIK